MGVEKNMKKIIAIFVMLLMLVSTVSVFGYKTENINPEKCEECGKINEEHYGMTDIPPKSEEALRIMDTDPKPTGSFDDLPSQFSWKNYGGNWLTPVKDQASPKYCGSCYIFGAWAAFEAAINIASGYPDTDIILSEQYGLSCINSGCNGCGGGWGSTMIENIVSTATGQQGNGINGVPIDSCMPYQADDTIPCSNKCSDWDYHSEPLLKPDDKLWQIKDWGWTSSFSEKDPNDWDTIKTWLYDKGPLAVTIAWDNGIQNFVENNHDPNDVYEQDSSDYVNHLICLCGWVDDPDIYNGGYWILKNSHGTSQGYGGYCNIAYGCNQVACSECNWIIAEDWPEEEKGPGPVDVDMAVFSDFDYDPEFPHPGEEIEFTDISDGDVALREWDFNGDGVIDSNKKHPIWTYSQPGEYEVTLTVHSEWGLHSSRTKNVEVKNNWPPVIEGLPMEFVGHGLTYHFDARYCYDPDGTITDYLWDFDDGTTSDEKYLDHTFPEGDVIYEVTLTLTDNDGGTSSDTCQLKIDQTVPPVTNIHHGIGSTGSNWYKTTQRISFSATDWTEVIDTFYRIDGGSWKRYAPSENEFIPVGSEGEHTVEAYSVDYWGNEEVPVSETFWIDKTEPTVDVVLSGNEEDDWYINKVDVTVSGEDDLSGIDKFFYRYKTSDWIEYNGVFTIDDYQGLFILHVMAVDNAGNQFAGEEEIRIKNINGPTIPTIQGPTSGEKGEELTYNIQSFDPENEISYYIDWGDGDEEGWLGPYDSGEKIAKSHSYNSQGSFVIKVKAKNQYDIESDWGTLVVSMPKTKNNVFPFLQKIISDFPILKYVLQLMIRNYT